MFLFAHPWVSSDKNLRSQLQHRCNCEFCLLSAAKTATSLCGRHLIVAHIYASSNNSNSSNTSNINQQHGDATAIVCFCHRRFGWPFSFWHWQYGSGTTVLGFLG